eukprot:4882291-Pyramimonas_sp.AAC.1
MGQQRLLQPRSAGDVGSLAGSRGGGVSDPGAAGAGERPWPAEGSCSYRARSGQSGPQAAGAAPAPGDAAPAAEYILAQCHYLRGASVGERATLEGGDEGG